VGSLEMSIHSKKLDYQSGRRDLNPRPLDPQSPSEHRWASLNRVHWVHEQLKQWLSVGDCRPESVDVGSWDGSAMSAGAEGVQVLHRPTAGREAPRRRRPLPAPGEAVVVCIDDSHIARPWSGPSQSCRYARGIPERQTHDYARHGVTSLFAALNVATGEVTDACYPRHRHQQFLKFLKKTAAAYPRTELRRLARARPECGRPDRLGTNHAPERRPRHRRAQEAALPAPAHRRPHHPGTTTNLDPDRPDMALGQRSRRSFHRPRAPACPYLTVSRPIHPPGTARRSRTTRRALSHAQLTQRPRARSNRWTKP
jgi:hypothetical protein